jgi:hypothetical protein
MQGIISDAQVGDDMQKLSIHSNDEPYCTICRRFFQRPAKKGKDTLSDSASTGWVKHHKTVSSLEASAANGCPLCFSLTLFTSSEGIAESSPIWIKRSYYDLILSNSDNDGEQENDRNEIDYDDFAMQNQHIGIAWKGIKNGKETTLSNDIGPAAVYLPSDPIIIPSQKSTASIDIKHWLTTCCTTHSCEKDRIINYLPHRLLECSSSGLRLVDSDALVPSEENRYAALSYSWGPNPTHLILTIDNMGLLKRGIAFKDLPLTFSDAVQICCGLDIKYLWIDSLCIIQSGDEGRDWVAQLSQMHNVYGSCVLQIAATYSTDAHGGCFHSRPKGGRQPTILPPARFEDIEAPEYVLKSAVLLPGTVNYFQEFKLHSRGWVFQERLLSPRTIYLDKDDISLQCHEYIIPTSMYFSNPEVRDKMIKQVPEMYNVPKYDWRSSEEMGVIWGWTELVDEYTKTKLTKPGDRLVAFSSISQRVCESNEFDYIAGYPLQFLPNHLLWHCAGGPRFGPKHANQPEFRHERTLDAYSIPSWSWGASQFQVHFYSFSDHTTTAAIVSTHVKLVDKSNKYGPMTDCNITLKGPQFHLKVKSFRSTESQPSRVDLQGDHLLIENFYSDNATICAKGPGSFTRDEWIEAYKLYSDGEDVEEEDDGSSDSVYVPSDSFDIWPDKSVDYTNLDIWKPALCLVIEAEEDRENSTRYYTSRFNGLCLLPSCVDNEGNTKYCRLGMFGMSITSDNDLDYNISRMMNKEITIE